MIRGKILLWSILVMGSLAALLGILQMWWEPLDNEVFLKSLGTILTLGTFTSFLIAVDYDLPSSKTKILLGLSVIFALSLTGLIILQLWWDFFELITFGKLLATNVIFLLLASFFMVVSEDLGTNKSLKDENYID